LPGSIAKTQQKIWGVIALIPQGKVTTYGQIAFLAGLSQQARLVGRILSNLPKGTRLPWHRVVNAEGKIVSPSRYKQIKLLAKEGVLPVNGRIDLKTHQWQP
jgi:methylated-DNA-protein-cysteine methyltransferase-like protein